MDADAAHRLAADMAQEISAEIDREFIRDIQNEWNSRENAFFDSGYFYAPYVPLVRTPPVLATDPVYQEAPPNWKKEGF